jgi:hypothetical protein
MTILTKAEDVLKQANALSLRAGNSSANQQALSRLKEDARGIIAEATPIPPKGEPGPAPEPSPTPIPAKPDLFLGAKTSDFNIQNKVAGAVTDVADPTGAARKVIKLAVGDEDNLEITGNPRVELYTPSNLFKDGSDFWAMFEVFFPEGFVTPPNGEFMICAEGPYGAPFAGSPPWSLGIFTGDKIGWQRNESHAYDIPWQLPLVRGAWQKVLVHQKFASSGGFVEGWLNGEQVTFFADKSLYNPSKIAPTTKLATKTLDKSIAQGPWVMHLDLYRKLHSVKQVEELFFGPLLIGSTRASVGG